MKHFTEASVVELLSTVDWMSVGKFLMTAVPVWMLGAFIGLLLPRPRWLSFTSAKSSALYASAELGARISVFGRVAIAFHGFMILRELWFRFTSPGTFRRCCVAFRRFVTGHGWSYPMETEAVQTASVSTCDAEDGSEDDWCVKEADLRFFQDRAGPKDVGASPWEKLSEKEIPGTLKYVAYRRTLPSRKTEYKSITINANSCPHEVMDFYLNDPVRQQWDPMLTTTETLLEGRFEDRKQVVHWVRSFPFSFLSDRDYTIGRRVFEEDGKLFGISKAVPFPSHDPGRLVPCTSYWSMWSHTATPCPWESGCPATETVLLHMEDFKIPENLARFAVRHGMWGFVQKMTPACSAFVARRRAAGVPPNSPDPAAFGAPTEGEKGPSSAGSDGSVPLPSHRRSLDLRHSLSTGDLGGGKGPPMSGLKRVASAVVAGSMLIALGGLGRQQQAEIEEKRDERRRARRARHTAAMRGGGGRDASPRGSSLKHVSSFPLE